MVEGLIFDIKRYAIHDGPGIRTTVFFKGCPLSCWWCHNPEGQSFGRELMVWSDRCIECRTCISACPSSAISISNSSIVTERGKCRICGACAAKCPANAREIVGKTLPAEELMAEIQKDHEFYGESGGLTASGGEPLAQPVFLRVLLKRCKDAGIHTTVDTSGYAERKTLAKISNKVDLFLYDLKMMNPRKHKLHTGVSNKTIIENLKMLDKLGKQIVIRFPLIPHVNTADADITSMCMLLSGLKNIKRICILPYNKLGIDKAKRLGKKARPCAKPSDRLLAHTLRLIKNYGLAVKIGG
ncbi:MAG: glycyl-radical enzyme activating protein [Candidatus Bathyarchaeota archaeon]|nr:glycyl-radical enzyme activating protein [Candidatus Bathyarchaeota archaeon]